MSKQKMLVKEKGAKIQVATVPNTEEASFDRNQNVGVEAVRGNVLNIQGRKQGGPDTRHYYD